MCWGGGAARSLILDHDLAGSMLPNKTSNSLSSQTEAVHAGYEIHNQTTHNAMTTVTTALL